MLAAVEGLMSCRGEGWRFMEADWSAEAISIGTFDAIFAGDGPRMVVVCFHYVGAD
jgi:hypothetical protein